MGGFLPYPEVISKLTQCVDVTRFLDSEEIGWSCSTQPPRARVLWFYGGFVDQHDWDIVFDRIDAVTLLAFEGFRLFTVFECLLAGGTDQDFQQVFGDHVRDCTIGARFQGFKVSRFRRDHGTNSKDLVCRFETMKL